MRKHRRSLAQPCGSADAGIAAFIKSKSPVGRARNSDAHALADGLGRPSGGAQPERPLGAKIGAIVAFIDLQCGGQPPRPSRQIANPSGLVIVPPHQADSFQRFDSPQKDARPNACRFACDVQQPAGAIGEIDVSMAALQKKRAIARCLAAKGVSGGVSRRVGFRLYNAPADAALGHIVNQSFTDQELRELHRCAGELASAQASQARESFRGLVTGFFR